MGEQIDGHSILRHGRPGLEVVTAVSCPALTYLTPVRGSTTANTYPRNGGFRDRWHLLQRCPVKLAASILIGAAGRACGVRG